MKKRILSVIFALAMLLPMFTVGTFALTPEEEVKQYMAEVLEVFASGTFTIKARSTSPFGGSEMVPVTIASDGERMTFEVEMDWQQVFQSEHNSRFRGMLMRLVAQLIFGKKIRIIAKIDDITLVFPDRKMFVPMADISADFPAYDFEGAWGGILAEIDLEATLSEITGSKVTMNGKEYLCSEVDVDGGITRFYFLNGSLKRIEAQNEMQSVVWEIKSFTGDVDQAIFSTRGMRKMPSFLSSLKI